MKKTWIRLVVIFLLTVIFLYFFIRGVQWKEAIRYSTNVNWVLLTAAAGSGLIVADVTLAADPPAVSSRV